MKLAWSDRRKHTSPAHIRNVHFQRPSLASVGVDLVCNAAGPVDVYVGSNDFRPFLGQNLCNGGSNSGPAAP